MDPSYAAVHLEHRWLLQIRRALTLADAFDIDQFDTFTVPKPITDATETTPSNNYSSKQKYQSRTPFHHHDQLADKGNPGKFQGSFLDNRIKERRQLGVRARNSRLIEDVPEMVVTSPLQIVE